MTGTAPQILIVDDDSAIRVMYDEILGKQGYRVATAGSGAAAIEAIEQLGEGVDVLVLDIGLPDADGDEVARNIVAMIGQRPTLFVSGWTDEFFDLTNAPGRWLIMRKPVQVTQLIAAVDWLAGRSDDRPTFANV